MSFDILIEELNGSLWVAALEDGQLSGLDVDPFLEEVRWGSVYWAKVARIDKSMDAAFVNLDGVNIGLLNNKDVRIVKPDGGVLKGGDIPIGELLQPGEMIAVQAKSGYLPKDPDVEQAEDKNPKVSMDIVLQGRYLLHTPLISENRISRRIRNKKMRTQLMKMLETIDSCEGCILRAAAANTQTDILRREARILQAMWEQIQEHFYGEEPVLIMNGPDAIQRTISDQASATINRVELTTMEHFSHAEEWCEVFAPDLVPKIHPVELEDNGGTEFGLFEYRDIIGQIESLLQPYVILKDGGFVLIEETAALTAIDVNRGADKRSNIAINNDAAAEIARHLRLRNIGGLVVVDFLRLKNKKEYDALEKKLEDLFNDDDPCTVTVHGKTNAGLIELVRQRRTPTLLARYESIVGPDYS